MDLKTIFALTAILNILIVILLSGFLRFKDEKNRILQIFFLAKVLQATAWILLILRGKIPDAISVGLANPLILFAYGIEMLAITSLGHEKRKQREKQFGITSFALAVIFWAVMYFNNNIRIAYVSFIVFIWHFIVGQQLIFKHKRNNIKIAIGIIYVILSLTALSRFFSSLFIYKDLVLFTTNTIETVAITGVFLSNFIGIIALLMLIKEQDEKKIRISEENYKNFTEFLPQIVFEINNKGEFVYLNNQAYKLTGYTPEDLEKGFNLKDIFEEEDLIKATDNFRAMQAGKGKSGQEYTILKKNGETFPALIYSSLIINKNGSWGLRGIIVDITERKKSEQQIRKLSVAVEQSANTIVITDIVGNIEYVNPRFVDLTGYTAEEARGKNPRILNARTQPKGYYLKMWETITNGEIWKGEFHNKKKNGEYFWENVTITPIKDEKGKIINYLAVKEDITEKKQVATALAESEEKYRIVADYAYDWEYWVDASHHFVYISPAVERISGYKPDEFYADNKLMTKIIHPEDKTLFLEHRDEVENNPERTPIEFRIITKNNDIEWVGHVCRNIYNYRGEMIGVRGNNRLITKRKKIEEALKNSEKKHKRLFNHFRMMSDNIPDLVWSKNLKGEYTFVNKAICEKLLIANNTDEPIGKTDMFFVNRQRKLRPKNKTWHTLGELCVNSDKIVIKNEKAQRFNEFGNIKGAFIYLDVYKAPILNNKGKMVGTVGHGRIVTKEKEIEKALKESEEKFRAIIETAIDWIWEVDETGTYTYSSPNVLKILGYSDKEIVGVTAFDLMPEKEKERVSKIFIEYSSQNKAIRNLENINIHKNGKHIVMETSAFPFFNANGELLGYRGIDRDVSMRNKNEKALKESEERLRLAQNAGNIGTWEWNVENDEIIWSDMTYEIFGLQKIKETLSSDEYFKHVHPQDKERLITELDEALRNKKDEHRTEYRIIKNKEVLWIDETSQIFTDKKGDLIKMIGVLQNITNRKNAEKALKDSEARLRNSNKTKDMFFSIVAHDLKSPFNTMLGFSDLLVNNFKEYEEADQIKYLGIINQGIHSTYKLLENLLLWSQTQRGTIDFKPEKENLYLLSIETFSLLKQLSENKSIKLTNCISGDMNILADKNMFQTILRNLISNAIKFTPAGGNIVLSAKPKADKSGQSYAQISVKDDGAGISKEKQEQLFKISENISTKGTEGEAGTGLGLILCKEFIEKHGGEIWVESKNGKGSEFIFTIPNV